MSQHASLETERELLSAVLADNGALYEVGGLIAEADFFARGNATIYHAMKGMAERGDSIDLVSLRGELEDTRRLAAAGGDEALLALVEALPIVAHVESYARRIAALSTVRLMATAATTVVARSRGPIADVDAFLDEAEAALSQVAQHRRTDARGAELSDLVGDVTEAVMARAANQGIQGVPTGLLALDRYLRGLKPGQLIIVAGRPGMGKTALALHMADVAAKAGQPVDVFSLEMSREECVERMVISEARVPNDRARSGAMTADDWNRWAKATKSMQALPVHVDDTPAISLWQLRSKVRRQQVKRGLGLVIIDYLQLMRGESKGKREEEVASISRGLKALAKECEVPVVAVAQLNRQSENRGDKRPGLSDLRESGQIEQDADVILFLFRECVYDRDADKSEAEVIIGKQRAGATGTVKCRFLPEFYRFEGVNDDADYGAVPNVPPMEALDEWAM